MLKSITLSIGLLALLIVPSAQAKMSNDILSHEQTRHYAQWRWGTPIPTTRPEVVDAINRDNARRQQEAEAWAKDPRNIENQDPEIRGLSSTARFRFYSDRGFAKNERGDYAGALSDYNKAVLFGRYSSGLYNNRGLVKYNLNDLSGALEDYNLSIQLERISVERATIFYNRGLLKQRLNDREGAIQDLRQAAELYKEQGKTEDYQDALNQLQKMNVTL
jgi:tetratricopeptide (TPR) repeat protein